MATGYAEQYLSQSEGLWQEDPQIYPEESPKLDTLLKLWFRVLLEAERHKRSRGVNMESLQQVLSATYTCSKLMLETDLPIKTRERVAGRLPQLLERVLGIVGQCQERPGARSGYDLGLAGLLREEIHDLASEHGWAVEVEAEPVHPSAMSETVAWLSVREALQQAALNPNTQWVNLTIKLTGDQLAIKVLIITNGPELIGAPENVAAAPFLAPLYARLTGGSCRWRDLSRTDSGRASGSEMELTLPLETPQIMLKEVGELPSPSIESVAAMGHRYHGV